MKSRIAVFCFLNFAIVVTACAGETDSSAAGPIPKMYRGAVASIEWYDVPIAALDIAQLILATKNPSNKPFSYPPSPFEQELQSRIGGSGTSFISNQISEVGGAALFGSRLLYNIGSDLMGHPVSVSGYQRTFIF
jgi:hypothetical protein